MIPDSACVQHNAEQHSSKAEMIEQYRYAVSEKNVLIKFTKSIFATTHLTFAKYIFMKKYYLKFKIHENFTILHSFFLHFRNAVICLIVAMVLLVISGALNIYFVYKRCSKQLTKTKSKTAKYKRASVRNGNTFVFQGKQYSSFTTSSSSSEMETSFMPSSAKPKSWPRFSECYFLLIYVCVFNSFWNYVFHKY